MKKITWEKIDRFDSLSEYNRFVDYIEGQIKANFATEVTVDEDYKKGEIFGGRWFRDNDTNEIWRLIPPDFPFCGTWEPVDVMQTE